MIKSLLITLLICATLVHAVKKTPRKRTTTPATESKDSSGEKEELSDDETQSSDESSEEDDDDEEDNKSKSKLKRSNFKETSSKPKSNGSKSKELSSKSKSKSKDTKYPALTCIIFSDVGCKVECRMIGAMYNVKTDGSCSIHNTCDCTSSQDASLDALWKRKFNSDALLRQIKKNANLSKQVRQQLKQPFRTEKQSKQDLKSILKPDQFKKLRTRDISLASKLTKQNGNLDYENIEAYVLGVLRWVLPSPNNILRGYQYQAKLKNALKETGNKDALRYIIGEVRRSKNKDLMNIVDEYVQKNNLKEQSAPAKSKFKDTAQTLEDFVGFTIIDEFINYIKYHKWLDHANVVPFEPPRVLHYVLPPPPPPLVWVPAPPPVWVPPPPPVFVPPPPPVFIPPPPPQGYYY